MAKFLEFLVSEQSPRTLVGHGPRASQVSVRAIGLHLAAARAARALKKKKRQILVQLFSVGVLTRPVWRLYRFGVYGS